VNMLSESVQVTLRVVLNVHYIDINVVKLASRLITNREFIGLDPYNAWVRSARTDRFNRFYHDLPDALQKRQYVGAVKE
jgi:hypothetical protein